MVLLAACCFFGKLFWDYYLNYSEVKMWLSFASGLTLFFLAILLPLIWLFQKVLESNKEMILRVRDRLNIFVAHDFEPLLKRLGKVESYIEYLNSVVDILSNDYTERASLDDDEVCMNMEFEDLIKSLGFTGFSKVKFGKPFDLDNLFTPNMGGKTAAVDMLLRQIAEDYERTTGNECKFLQHKRFHDVADPKTKKEMAEFLEENKCPFCPGKDMCWYYNNLYKNVVLKFKEELEKAKIPEPIIYMNEALQVLAEEHQALKGEPLCMLLLKRDNTIPFYGGKTEKEAIETLLKANNCNTCDASVFCIYYPTYLKQVERLKELEAAEKTLPECDEISKTTPEGVNLSLEQIKDELKNLNKRLETRNCKGCYKNETCPVLAKKKLYEDRLNKENSSDANDQLPPEGASE